MIHVLLNICLLHPVTYVFTLLNELHLQTLFFLLQLTIEVDFKNQQMGKLNVVVRHRFGVKMPGVVGPHYTPLPSVPKFVN